MQIYYFHAPEGNFGDDLNRWIWEEVLPGAWDRSSSLHFSGIGTILGPAMPPHRHWIICGSGTGYGSPAIDLHSPDVLVSCVRGPLTARATGLRDDAAVTDGAVLLAGIQRFQPLVESERSGTIFIPHKSAFVAGRWAQAASLAGVELVDPRGDCESVIQRIRRSRLVLADSMHAAIVADTLRVPWTALTTSPEINEFKWLDWTLSVGVPYDPVMLPASSLAERWRGRHIAAGQPPVRTSDRIGRALEIHAAQARASRRPTWKRKLGLARLKHTLLGDWPQAVASVAGRAAGTDARFAAAAAQELDRAAQRRGILSDQATWRSRLEEFQYRLVKAGDYARSFEDNARTAASD